MNRGAERLRGLYPDDDGAQSRVAAELGVDQSTVNRWWNSKRKPESTERAKMEDKYGIGWRSWDEPAEQVDDEETADTDPAPAPTGTENL